MSSAGEAMSTTLNDHGAVKVSTQQQKSTKGGWKSAIFIIFVEVAERFSYYGVVGNLITYLTNVLGMPMATAAKNVNIWIGASAIFPLVGAFVADSYLGRYNTILISSFIYLIGLVLLTVSVSAVPFHLRRAAFFTSLYLVVIGEGGHRPCVQTFAADQFDENSIKEKKEKSSFFNWWYLGIVTGATIAILVVIYVQDYVGWGVGFGMLAAAVVVAVTVFLIGSARYRRQRAVGSPFTRVAQVFVAAARKRNVVEKENGWNTGCREDGRCWADSEGRAMVRGLARTPQFKFLDKATILDDLDSSTATRNPWRLCSVNQVEEVKLLLRLIPIWLTCLMFAVVISQLSTYFTKQGSTMIRSIGSHFHIPAASFQVITGLTILTSVPIYDRLIVPMARNITGLPSGITMLQRMGMGMLISILTMVVAAIVEAKRVDIARSHGLLDSPKSMVPMRAWWLVPQYMLVGVSDVLMIVGLQELFYSQMPEPLRSVGAAAALSVVGVGSFMSSAVISVVQDVSSRCGNKWLGDNLNRAHVDYFYWVLAGLSTLNLCIYVWVARGFVYKQTESDGTFGEEEMRETF